MVIFQSGTGWPGSCALDHGNACNGSLGRYPTIAAALFPVKNLLLGLQHFRYIP